ncbi:putative aldouronate transport system substrate-binding protein [Hungatella effluvii]|uniref:Putative aldouronate transport system substrate-binding protein n=1 Tax=Hungatella effluvii TaxID=1096246 RepID=A0A2V3YCG5_9FIRM|nr:extracellular solute-binding protein [Hungatella effluvii]PXX57091.1 putative aldouronate transport system substrate-binding protein [Hungatella effluvii]
MKKWSLLIAAAIIVTVIAGCAVKGRNNDNSSESAKISVGSEMESNSTTGTQLDPVTLKIVLPGDRPADMDSVIAEAEKRMKDTLNIKLNVVFYPFSDMKQKMETSLAAGEEIDLIWDNLARGMQSHISNGYYAPLDELLDKYGSAVYSMRGKEMFDANKYGGKYYCIPLSSQFKQGAHYEIRKDIREAMGIAPITSKAELLDFARKVKAAYPEMVPIMSGNSAPTAWAALLLKMSGKPDYYKVSDAFDSPVLYYKNDDGKVYNLFDIDENDALWKEIMEARMIYQEGLINPDILSTQGDLITQGKAAVFSTMDLTVEQSKQIAIKSIQPEAQLESVILYDLEPDSLLTDYKAWNFLCIPESSKNKERAMMFLEWAHEKENYDLLAYGIEGVHWKPVGEDKYEVISNNYRWYPYAWIWNPVLDRIPSYVTEQEYEAEKFFRNSDNFKTSQLTGFVFDPTSVQNQIAQHSTIEGKYVSALLNGVMDPVECLEKWKAEDYNNVKAVQEELQKQIDMFLAGQL